jgi:hypothetical protein
MTLGPDAVALSAIDIDAGALRHDGGGAQSVVRISGLCLRHAFLADGVGAVRTNFLCLRCLGLAGRSRYSKNRDDGGTDGSGMAAARMVGTMLTSSSFVINDAIVSAATLAVYQGNP